MRSPLLFSQFAKCFFPGPIHHRQFDAALLNVHHIIRCIAIVSRWIRLSVDDLSRHSRRIKEGLGVESGEGSVGFRLLDFHFQVQRSRFRARPGPSRANKLASIRLYKTGQRPARNVPRIESDGERDRIGRRNSDWASRYPHLVVLLLWLPERALPKIPSRIPEKI